MGKGLFIWQNFYDILAGNEKSKPVSFENLTDLKGVF